MLVAKADPPVRCVSKISTPAHIWQAPTILRIASVLLNYRLGAEEGSTAKMLPCLQEDASRVTNNALHLVKKAVWQGFAFALQKLRLAAHELKRQP